MGSGKGARSPITILLVATLGGCDWTPFDRFQNEPPVFAFSAHGHGGPIALSRGALGSAELASAGTPGQGVTFYTVGNGVKAPSGDPDGDVECVLRDDDVSRQTACVSAKQLAAVRGTTQDTGQTEFDQCFAIGYGVLSNSIMVGMPGPRVVCVKAASRNILNLHAPGDAPRLASPFRGNDLAALAAVRVSFASNGTGTEMGLAALLMGDEQDGSVYLYRQGTSPADPIDLDPIKLAPTDMPAPSYGAAVAAGHTGALPVYAVGAPGNIQSPGKVYVFVDNGDGGGARGSGLQNIACFGDGSSTFGQALALGDVNGDGALDLVVTSGDASSPVVKVFTTLPSARGGGCGSWPGSPMTLSCTDSGGVSGCASGHSDFGHAFAVGDFNADGRTELAVAAPGLTAEGNDGSGAVFLYTLAMATTPADARYLGKPEAGVRFGEGLARGSVGQQDTLFASARGTSTAYALWCVAGSPSGARCRK